MTDDDTTQPSARGRFRLRYAALSDVGRVRKDNQDSGYAGPHLLLIADGVGGAARGDVASSTPTTKTLSYVNTGSVPVTISSVALAGTNAAAFAVANNCPVAPATVDVGTRCTIDVTFTPDAGKASTATLTITDDTPAAKARVARIPTLQRQRAG